jgi:CHASE3 domain sensor protein
MSNRVALSIRTKLLAAFGVSLLLMLILGLFSIARLGTENSHVDRLAAKVVPATQGVGQATALMNGFQAAFENYVAKTAAFRALADKGQVQAAGAVVGTGPGDHAYDQLKAAAQAWDDYKATVARAAAKSSRSAYDSSKTLIIALLIAAVAIAAAVALLFSRRLGAGSARSAGPPGRSPGVMSISTSRCAAATSSARWRATSPRWSNTSSRPRRWPKRSPRAISRTSPSRCPTRTCLARRLPR